MKRLFVVMLLLVPFVVFASPSKEKAPASSQASAAKQYTFGVVYNSLVYPWYQSEKAGIDREAATLGVKLIDMVSQDDPAKEISNIEDMITKHVDVIILLGTDEATGGHSAQLASEAHIPLIALSRQTSGKVQPTVTVATDTYQQATTIVQYMAKKMGGKGEVAEIEGVPGVSNVTLRAQAFKDVIAKFPGIKVVADVPGYFDPAKAEAAMSDILTAHPNVKAVYAHNDGMMAGIVRGITSAGRNPADFILVGFDGEPDGISRIQDGTQTATMGCVPAQEGTMGVLAAYMAVKGEKVPAFLYTPSVIVDKSNVAKFPGWLGNGLGPFLIKGTDTTYDPQNLWKNDPVQAY